ncbi:HHIP-like protein 1 isoform X3 [Pomacea canaliculata]|nr:HHIP-like protein 1 isoform X3 [Pomacea canaliculata]
MERNWRLNGASAVGVMLMVIFSRFPLAAGQESSSSCYCLKKVIGSLFNPVEMIQFKRDGSLRTLVVEQKGHVRLFMEEDENQEGQLFMDIRDRVKTSEDVGEERGLLSVVLHPSYTRSPVGRVFAYYIRDMSGYHVNDYAYVSEFLAYNDVVDSSSERFLLRVRQPFRKGNGGQLLFGNDSFLYIFTGDGTGDDDLEGNAQNKLSFNGKVLRINVNQQSFEFDEDSASAFPYKSPVENPFHGDNDSRQEIFAFGLRNPWRCSLDTLNLREGTGRIFCGDTGTDQFEEINIIESGKNYGWNIKEGRRCHHSQQCSAIANEGLPIYTYPHSSEWGSAVVGGYVYRGGNFTGLYGAYVYGDAVTGKIAYLVQLPNTTWSSTDWPQCSRDWCPCDARDDKLPYLLSFGQDAHGELFVMSTSEFSVLQARGGLFRVVAPTGNAQKQVSCKGCKSSLSVKLLLLSLVLLISKW